MFKKTDRLELFQVHFLPVSVGQERVIQQTVRYLCCKRHHEILKCHKEAKCKILSFSAHPVMLVLR